MRARDELWLIDDPGIDEPPDLLTIPEVKQYIVHEFRDEDLGLRSLIERSEALAKPLWREDNARKRHATSSKVRRRPVLHAA